MTSSTLVSRSKCLCSLMVKQRIYIPCATDNWPMWVRLPPEAPINVSLVFNGSTTVSKTASGGSNPSGYANNVRMAERPNARVCKTLKPSVRIRLLTPDCPYGQIGKGGSLKRSVITIGSNPIRGTSIMEVWQSPVYCTCLENRRSERVREFESHRFHHMPV